MPDELTRLLGRLGLYSRQLGLEFFRLAGGAPKLYRGCSVRFPPRLVYCRQLCSQLCHLGVFGQRTRPAGPTQNKLQHSCRGYTRLLLYTAVVLTLW